MDGRKFDDLTRHIGRNHSRRAMLKGLLGLGGAVATGSAVAENLDARTIGTRPTIPPPSSPSCPLPNQMCGGECCEPGKCKEKHCCENTTDVWCAGACCTSGLCTSDGNCCTAEQKVCGSICCPSTAECSIDGNQDVCCDPTTGGAPCGLECCDDPLQCCDRECCGSESVCLNKVFPGLPEEYCCPASLTCGGGCCDGVCFTPLGSQASGFERSCCPAAANLCPGVGAFSGVAVCCSGEAFECCQQADGSPICLTPQQCCSAAECTHLTDPAACLEGACIDFDCVPTEVCDDGSHCCTGYDNACCPAGDDCCERMVDGAFTVLCTGPDQCCSDIDCTSYPASFCNLTTNECDCTPLTCEDLAQQGICGDGFSNNCGVSINCGCGSDLLCCQETIGEPGDCRECCTVDDCDPAADVCTTVSCLPDGTCSPASCGSGFACCEETLTCIDPQRQCCELSDCEVLGFDLDCISDCVGHVCVASGDSCDDGHGVCCHGDCCEDRLQCCDGGCCGDQSVCLNLIYESPAEEEPCCPTLQTCDGGCCDGECYFAAREPLTMNGYRFPIANFAIFYDRECCPPTHSVCPGALPGSTCCDDATEKCCHRRLGIEAVCIAKDACCTNADCPGECGGCDTTDPVNSVCGGCNGCQQCIGSTCSPRCDADECCDTDLNPRQWMCLEEGQCCSDADCVCAACDDNQCVAGCAGSGCCLTGAGEFHCFDNETTCCTGSCFCFDDENPNCCQTADVCPDCRTCDDQGNCIADIDVNGMSCASAAGQVCCAGSCCAIGEECSVAAGETGGICASGGTTTSTTTTTTTPPNATTTPSPVTTTTGLPGCATDQECGTGNFCNEGTCAVDRCLGPSECAPCTTCTRLTGACLPLCTDPCQFCNEQTFPATCGTRPGCCRNGCEPGCVCHPASGTCLCTPGP